MFGVSVWGAAAGLTVVCAAIARLFNSVQPHPYMDEIFHVPQIQQYCSHNFSHWDPMITTLPGLYFSTLVWVEPLSWILQVEPTFFCTTAVLRAQNVIFTVMNFLILHWLLRKLHKNIPSSTELLLSSLNLATFPLLFFFSFLYYTDVGSVLLVLAAYALSIKHHHPLSASVLLLAVAFRQTAIVWVVFVAGSVGLRVIEPKFNLEKKGTHPVLSYTIAIVKSLFTNLPILMVELWPYAAVALGFVGFVLWNGSIVVGDKAHHQAALHLPQVLYFAVFACFFASGQLVLNWRLGVGFVRTLRKPFWILSLCVLVLCGWLAVHFFTYAHKYLLSDNRHYPFYLWKNIFRRHEAVKYLFTPLYSIGILFVTYAVSKSQSELWTLLFWCCTAVALVPQALLEFRYFILPYLLFRLHAPQGTKLSLLAELVLYTTVNTLTIWMFLYRPFYWPNSASTQRFMW